MFFGGWESIGRITLSGVLAYVAMVALIRISGKHTLSTTNAYDVVLRIALGSIIATVTLSRSVALIDGLFAFAVLLVLQVAVSWTSLRSRTLSRLVNAEPALLAHRGALLPRALRRERVVEAEIMEAIREQGFASLAEVEAVVLEANGRLSVVPRSPPGEAAAALEELRRRSPDSGGAD